ncbi:hypothetical protein B1218_34325, partial [Pseudomonas ogarae]
RRADQEHGAAVRRHGPAAVAFRGWQAEAGGLQRLCGGACREAVRLHLRDVGERRVVGVDGVERRRKQQEDAGQGEGDWNTGEGRVRGRGGWRRGGEEGGAGR